MSASNYDGLEIIHEYQINFTGKTGLFSVMGKLPMDLSTMKVSIHMSIEDYRKERFRLNLYHFNGVQKQVVELSERLELSYNELETDFLILTDLLEKHREELFKQAFEVEKPKIKPIGAKEREVALEFLKQKNLLQNINELLGKTGIIGEERNRLLLYLVGMSFKTPYPLHAIIYSSSGAGKSHLLNTIGECVPSHQTMSFSRISSKALYYFGTEKLNNKLLLFQDFDGVDKDGLYALRELQSNGSVSSSVTEKKQIGGNVPKQNLTSAKFSSIGATTRNIYTDNESRSIVMTIDESEEQTQRIIAFQGALSSGAIQKETLQEYKMQLSNITAMLEDIEIINPFANKLQLPSSVKMHRRLNQHFQDFVCLVTYMHQHQRKVKNNVIETTKEDVLQAIDLFFDVIWIKTDDLSATARKFYEELKTYLLKQDQEIVIDAKISTASFTQRELRLGLLKSKTQVHRMINVLHDLEYVNIKRGNKKRGIEYQVSYWDDYERNRIMLKEHLQNQI
jgi:hypothetical protein